MSQLRDLVEPIPNNYIGQNDRGMDAADHTVITQRLLQIVGPYSFELVEVLRSEAPTITTSKGKEHSGGLLVTGVVARLTVTIDDRTVSVEEAGGCEQAALKDGDGERLKHAMSDAFKRCAMRLGLGLHIWAQEMFFLHGALSQTDSASGASPHVPDAPPADTDQLDTIKQLRDGLPQAQQEKFDGWWQRTVADRKPSTTEADKAIDALQRAHRQIATEAAEAAA